MQRASRVSVICCGKTPTVTFEIFAAQRLHAKFRFEHSGDLLGLRTLAITHPAFENTRDFVPTNRRPPPRQKSFLFQRVGRGGARAAICQERYARCTVRKRQKSPKLISV
jgi:hypothetical protein